MDEIKNVFKESSLKDWIVALVPMLILAIAFSGSIYIIYRIGMAKIYGM